MSHILFPQGGMLDFKMANNTLRVKIQAFRGEIHENATEWLHSFDLVVNHYINIPYFVPPGGNVQAPALAQGGNAQAQAQEAQQLANAQDNEMSQSRFIRFT